MAKFRALEVQGFRAFCRKVDLTFDGSLAVLWGPNSQGKTSLCEGLEFLLTGTTVRRELTAGSQDEFAGALRNVHLAPDDEVYVQATIEGDDGTCRVVRRALVKDFEKRSLCESRLEIDGKSATQDDLRALGIVLSAPPMQSPILLQHTLAYLFSAKPGDRSAYFKALLEVADLDETRREIQDAIKGFAAPKYTMQAHLDRLKDIRNVLDVLKVQFKNKPDEARVRLGLEQAAVALLRDAGINPSPRPIDDLRATLGERQRAAFPVSDLAFPKVPETVMFGEDTGGADGLRAADSAVEKDVERFGNLYRELLRLHPVAEGQEHAIDCPACGTANALSPDRLRELQRRLRETDAYHRTLTEARKWLVDVRRNVEREKTQLQGMRLLPPIRERRKRRFGARELRALIGAEHDESVNLWIRSLRKLGRLRRRNVGALVIVVRSLPEEAKLAGAKLDPFRAAAKGFLSLRTEMLATIAEGEAVVTKLRDVVSQLVSKTTSTVGWQDVLDLYADAHRVSAHLQRRHAHDALVKEHERALKDFDDARDVLLAAKFTALSEEIRRWWEFLRPESLAAFESVGMRPKATRSVDFKVALYSDETQKTKTMRDAIAVFSGSQLHCLGVAAFLARSVRDGSGFLVLDDPVLSSDHEHRSGFVNRVIEELVNAKLQVILLTQEQRLKDDAGVRYEHLKPDLFRIEMTVPSEGTIITKTSDGIADKLARIKTLLNGSDEATRKQAAGELRDTAERLCKEVLVRHFGPPKTLADFDNQVLAALIDALEKEQLFKQPDHKGKLALLKRWTNPGNHDAPVPSTSELKSAFGNLKQLAKEYLS